MALVRPVSRLIYGGTTKVLMGIVADAALGVDGEVPVSSQRAYMRKDSLMRA